MYPERCDAMTQDTIRRCLELEDEIAELRLRVSKLEQRIVNLETRKPAWELRLHGAGCMGDEHCICGATTRRQEP